MNIDRKHMKIRVADDAFDDSASMADVAQALASLGAELTIDAQGLLIRRKRQAGEKGPTDVDSLREEGLLQAHESTLMRKDEMSKIEELEAKVADLMKEISELKKHQEQEPDYSEWVGRLVMVRDGSNVEWMGPLALKGYYPYAMFPFHITDSVGYRQAKLYNDHQTIHMIPWSGGECPVNPDDLVMARVGEDSYRTARARLLIWEHRNDGMAGDIVEYAVLEVHS